MMISGLKWALAAGFFVGVLALNACKKDEAAALPPDTTDRDLAVLARDTTGSTWFGRSAALRPRSSGSAHGQAWLRARFNPTAAAALDGAGRVRPGATFGTGSLIVKELHGSTSGGASLLAVMQKNPTSPNAAADGWVWAEFDPAGAVVVSATAKGAGCTGCHAQTGSTDATLLTKYFP